MNGAICGVKENHHNGDGCGGNKYFAALVRLCFNTLGCAWFKSACVGKRKPNMLSILCLHELGDFCVASG